MSSKQEVSRPLTARYSGVPGCPRVEVLSIDKVRGEAIVRSDKAVPGHEEFGVPLAHLSSFEGGERNITDAYLDQEAKAGPDETDARAYVETSARGLIGDLRSLIEIGETGRGNRSDDELEALGVSFDEVGCEDVDDAWERLDEMALAVEATTTFEVVLGPVTPDGPGRQLCFECDRSTRGGPPFIDGAIVQPVYDYEIRRVFYRYSWSGSADVELTGEEREVAEAFGRRVVPELGE